MNNEYYIKQTLRLAQKAIGRTRTNPMVGAVLTVMNEGIEEVIGRGYHHGYGRPHAEVEAVKNAHRRGFTDLRSAKLYVNLEPCCHYGKTPPCTELILREKIPHVVVGTLDPNPKVAGQGVAILKKNGVQVEVGFLEKECRELNRAFFKIHKDNQPWVTVKIAQTLDGKIARPDGHSKWITCETSRQTVHRMRAEYDAVLIGAGTVIQDNPALTVRLVKGRQPCRILVDGGLRSPLSSLVFNDEWKHQTIVLTAKRASARKIIQLEKRSVTVWRFADSERVPLKHALKLLLAEHQIASVLVEGGADIFGQFLSQRLADDFLIFTAPKFFGNGLPAFEVPIKGLLSGIKVADMQSENSGADILIKGRFTK